MRQPIVMLGLAVMIFMAYLVIEALTSKQGVPKMRNPPPPPKSQKDVGYQTEKIEADRIKKTPDKVFCFECEIPTPTIEHIGNLYCGNCGLLHTKNYI